MKFARPQIPVIACAATLSFLFHFAQPADAIDVGGVMIPEAVPHSTGKRLVLNGTAVRSVWGFDVYVVALYLKEKCQDVKAIMERDLENGKQIQITMLREVSAKKFISTVQKNIDVNFSEKEKRRFAPELAAFFKCFDDDLDLAQNSVVTFDYLPGHGTKIAVENRKTKLIPGDEFYHALLRLWIGQPLQASIKDGLVGKAS